MRTDWARVWGGKLTKRGRVEKVAMVARTMYTARERERFDKLHVRKFLGFFNAAVCGGDFCRHVTGSDCCFLLPLRGNVILVVTRYDSYTTHEAEISASSDPTRSSFLPRPNGL